MPALIYKLINRENGKFYIGQTHRTLGERWYSGHGYVGQPYLQHAINKYGKDSFYYEVIEILIDGIPQNILDEAEVFWIKEYDSTNHKIGYNIANGGNGPGTVSEETKQKISRGKKGKKQSEEHKAALSAVRKGKPKNKPFTEEHRKNISLANRGDTAPNAKLTLDEIDEIKKEYNSVNITRSLKMELAKKYGVSYATIWRILHDQQRVH